MNKIIRAVATIGTSLSLAGGFAGVAGASSGTNSYTGPSSHNTISSESTFKTTVHNMNRLSAENGNTQTANTGNVDVHSIYYRW